MAGKHQRLVTVSQGLEVYLYCVEESSKSRPANRGVELSEKHRGVFAVLERDGVLLSEELKGGRLIFS